jgi:predicted acyl esterase
VSAILFASTSNDDCDFVVKLIDVFPAGAELPAEYELPIAMEVRRGRYLGSFERPAALPPLEPVRWDIPMRDHDHVFRKGHRIMVQVQSSWFPVIDRNPQTFTPNIYLASPADFRPATQRVFSRPDLPSHLRLQIPCQDQQPDVL